MKLRFGWKTKPTVWPSDNEALRQWSERQADSRWLRVSFGRASKYDPKHGYELVLRYRSRKWRYSRRIQFYPRCRAPLNVWVPEYKRVEHVNVGRLLARKYRGRFYIGYTRRHQSFWIPPRGLVRVPQFVYFAVVKRMWRRWHK